MRLMDTWTHRDPPIKIECVRLKDDDSPNDV